MSERPWNAVERIVVHRNGHEWVVSIGEVVFDTLATFPDEESALQYGTIRAKAGALPLVRQDELGVEKPILAARQER